MKPVHFVENSSKNWDDINNNEYYQDIQIPRINSSTLTKASRVPVVSLVERLTALVLSREIAKSQGGGLGLRFRRVATLSLGVSYYR